MAKQSTMHFCKQIDSLKIRNTFMLGSVEKTNWYLQYLHYGNDAINYFTIIRDGDYAKVEIDIDIRLKNSDYVLSKQAQPLLDGQKHKRFESSYGNLYKPTNTTLEGYVTVRYNSIHTLATKKEEFTRTDNVHSNCQSNSKKEVVAQTENEFAEIAEKSFPSPQHESDLLQLLDNPDFFPDATLVCGPDKIRVHRGILSLRSPFFADIFQTQEGRDGIVDIIVDLEPDVLYAMLVHIYSGKTDHLTQLQTGDLLLAAEKYQLEELKLVCVEQLKASMAANNVFRSLVLGDSHDKSLKEHAVEFICQYKNFSDLEETEDWQVLLKKRPSLAMEVMTAIVKYLQNK